MKRVILALLIAALGFLGWGYRNAVSEPLLRRAHYVPARWPAGTAPVRIVFLSDIHVARPDMPPERLRRLVKRINRLRPDCVLIAGDFVSDKAFATRHVPTAEAIAPLAGLKPRVATIAVMGNHDHWRSRTETIEALSAAGVYLVSNGAERCGAVSIGGIDDDYTGHADVAATLGVLARMGGTPILLSHAPDVFPAVRGVGLTLAGHTHCGQITPPLIGPIVTASRYGRRYACGIIKEKGRTMIVTAGLGTSMIPLRYGTRPELWLISIGPRARANE